MRLWNHVFSFTPAPKEAIAATSYCTIGGFTSHFRVVSGFFRAAHASCVLRNWKAAEINLVAAKVGYFRAKHCNTYWQSLIAAARAAGVTVAIPNQLYL